MIAEFRKDMMRKFEITNLGLLHHFLGIGVIHRPSGIFIHQQKYVETLLQNFELKRFKSVVTPLISNKSYAKMMVMFLQMRLYWKIVGSLLHLTSTKLDIMFTPSLLSRFMHNSTKVHMGTAKRVPWYICGTIDFE